MKVFPVLIVGLAIGGAALWYYQENRSKPGPPTLAEEMGAAAQPAGDTIDDKLRALNLRNKDIKDEMARTGRVTRQAAQETTPAISNGTADTRTTIAIKGKLVADPDLSALRLSVNTTRGVVTLSGTVSSEANIGKAMLLALQTEGVQEVISTLQVKSM